MVTSLAVTKPACISWTRFGRASPGRTARSGTAAAREGDARPVTGSTLWYHVGRIICQHTYSTTIVSLSHFDTFKPVCHFRASQRTVCVNVPSVVPFAVSDPCIHGVCQLTDEGTPVHDPLPEGHLDEWARHLVALLEAIPREDRDAKPLLQLCNEVGLSGHEALGFSRAVSEWLTLFGAISKTDGPGIDISIKAATRFSSYFIRSLAAYMREERSVLYDWGRHANPDSTYPADILKGPQFLTQIERERHISANANSILPLRETWVSQLVIKAKVRGLGACYLMEYDPAAHMYQLKGGHRREGDADSATTMRREALEELPGNEFDFQRRDRLEFFADVDTILISRTIGVNTLYHFSFYLAHFGLRNLRINPASDRWISQKEVQSGSTKDGIVIASEWLDELQTRIPGGIYTLPYSLDTAQMATLKQIIRLRRWEIAGLVIGILGIVVSIVMTVV